MRTSRNKVTRMTAVQTNNSIPDDIIVWAVKSISGEVTQNMRLIAFSYSNNKAKFRFYVAEEPTDDEREIGEAVAVNFDSGLAQNLDALDIEFVVTKEPLGKLDTLGFGLFRRHEE